MTTIRIFINQLFMSLKIYMRFPEAVFWLIAFPILLLIGLGLLFGTAPDTKPKLIWSQVQLSSPEDVKLRQALDEVGLTVEVLPPEQAELRWNDGKLPALLEYQNGHYSLRVNSSMKEQGMLIASLVQQAVLMNQVRAFGVMEVVRVPVITMSTDADHDRSYVEYLLPGLLGLNLLMMGVFSVGMVDVTMRAKGGYKRLATTPLPRYVYLAAQLSSRIVMVIVSSILVMLVGAFLFHTHNQGSYLSLLLLAMLGAACFASLGYLLASFARNIEGYGGIANIVVLPLMMISGVYFSLDAAPTWLQRGADYLPLTPLIKTLRAVFNDGASLFSQGPSLILLVGWTAIFFVLAVKRFRWV